MESQLKNRELKKIPENFHPCVKFHRLIRDLADCL